LGTERGLEGIVCDKCGLAGCVADERVEIGRLFVDSIPFRALCVICRAGTEGKGVRMGVVLTKFCILPFIEFAGDEKPPEADCD
jgi:hypothetical protein